MAQVDLVRDGRIAHLVIDNPTRYNAMSLSMWRAVKEHVALVESDAELRVIVMRGAGEKAFVSGADISEFETQRADPNGVAAYDVAVREAQAALAQCTVPVVAAIRGVCMGGGLGLALAADIRYCTLDSRFRMPAARLGLGYGFSGMKQMVDKLGAARAAELFLTARQFDGHEAERIGLVHRAFERDEFDAAVAQNVELIAGNAPLTMAAAKLAIRTATQIESERDMAAVTAAVGACFESSDYVEGRQAFAAKREPKFTGR